MSRTSHSGWSTRTHVSAILKKADIVLMLAVAAVAAIWSVAGLQFEGESRAERAFIESGGQSWTYPLSDSLIVRVPGPRGTTSVAIAAGSASIISSPCINKICVRTGRLSRAGEVAVCLPNEVLLRLEGSEASEFDGITR